MSQMLSETPKLSFLPAENIAAGVMVNPLNFIKENAHPPFKLTYFEVEAGYSTPLDCHQVEECWLILKGHGLLEYEDQCYRIKEQDILYFSSLKKHRVHNHTNASLLICSIYW